MTMQTHEDVKVIDAVTVGMATVERDDALKFAATTVENLRYINSVWQEHWDRHDDAPVRLVTQTINSLLGLVVFTVEREFVRQVVNERLSSLVAQGWPAWTFELEESDADSLGELAYHLRNGVSHARVRFSSDSADPSEVMITIEDAPGKKKPVNWRAKISAADLLSFSLLYAQHVDDLIRQGSVATAGSRLRSVILTTVRGLQILNTLPIQVDTIVNWNRVQLSVVGHQDSRAPRPSLRETVSISTSGVAPLTCHRERL